MEQSQPDRRLFVRQLSAMGAAAFFGAGSAPAFDNPPPGANQLMPVPIQDVAIEDEFWSPKRKVWREVTIRDCFHKFETDRGGALNNFDKVRAGKTGGHAGDPWMDGLIYEMIRGASDFLLSQRDAALESQLDGYIARITAAAAINPHGYVNTYTQLIEPGHEWGLNGGFQLWQHEVYNLGALVDAGVHYYRATGKTALLSAGVRIANYMSEYMGPPPKRNIVPCHSLPEEALVRLYELVQQQPALKNSLPVNAGAYLALAEFWIENRGNNIGKPDWDADHHRAEEFVRRQEYGSGRPSWGPYAQDDAPVLEQKDIHGHAVRATLLCAGLAAAARVNGNEQYRNAAIRLWENMVFRRMHITGGVGAFATEEKFGPDYTLPNEAYLETCAAVGAGFFHRNMGLLEGHARYFDELERVLYNGALCGVSLAGDSYFYQNPLEAGRDRKRWSWHSCPCCPPMFLKLMGAMPGYIYASDGSGLYVNLFAGSRASTRVGAAKVTLTQTTRYPWEGGVRIGVDPERAAEFSLYIRVPAWSRNAELRVNGKDVAKWPTVRGYARLSRVWNKGDNVEVLFPMPVEQVRAHPLVQSDAGRVALMRGPIVYALESVDNRAPVRTTSIPRNAKLTAEFQPSLLGGVTVVRGAAVNQPPSADSLYTPLEHLPPVKETTFTAIPYYANANRGPVDMAVWIPST